MPYLTSSKKYFVGKSQLASFHVFALKEKEADSQKMAEKLEEAESTAACSFMKNEFQLNWNDMEFLKETQAKIPERKEPAVRK